MTPYQSSYHNAESDSFISRLKSGKKLFAPLAVLALIIGVIVTVQQVQRLQEVRKGAFAGGAQLLLSSSADNNTVKEGDEFKVDVLVDTKGNTISGADVTLTFPTDTLELTKVDLGSFLTVPLAGPPVITGGKVNFVVTSPPSAPVKGSGVLATLTFTALKKQTQPAVISFDSSTQIAAIEHLDTNVIDTMTPLSITIQGSTITNGATLTFTPSKTTVAPNEEFTLTATMDTKGRQITGAEIHLLYPEDKIEVLDATEGTFLPLALQKNLTFAAGHAMFSVGSTPVSPANGTGIVAIFRLKAKPNTTGTAALAFSPASKVAELGKVDLNVIGATNNTSVTISGVPVTVVPTVTTAPTITPTKTPTPTVSVTPKPKVFKATLTANQEVPPTTSPGTGTAYVQLAGDRKTALVSLTFTGLTSPQVSAHIHAPAPAGSNTPPVFNLPVGTFNEYPITLTAAQATQLEGGLWYVNVHTENFGNGEIRGQFALTTDDPTITPTGIQPTNTLIPTLTSQATSMLISMKIPTIGSNEVTENTTPVNPSRPVNIEMYKGTTLSRTVSGILTFDGNIFKGNINTGEAFQSGSYTLKLKLPNSLRKTLGTFTIAGNISVPLVTMVMGDTIVDNKLNIFDYNIIISCYEGRATEASCNGDNDIADLNDNGTVDSIDYNLILRSFDDQIIGD